MNPTDINIDAITCRTKESIKHCTSVFSGIE